MVLRQGRLALRPRADRPRPQQLRAAPRLRLHADPAHGRSAAATASATCTSAAPAAATCCRSTARRSINAVINQTDPDAPRRSCRPSRAIPAGLADPSQFNPLTANITYMPRDFHSSPVQSWHISRAARAECATCCSTSPTSATAPTTCCCSPTTTRRSRTTPPARSPLQDRRPIPSIRRHHLRVQRRQVALQGAAGEVGVARQPRRHAAQLADAVGGEGQRRAVARELQRQLPGAAGFPQPGRRLRPVRTTTSRTTTPPASCGRCRSARAGAGLSDVSPVVNAIAGGWELAGINPSTPASRSPSPTTPGATFVVSGIAQDFRGANNYRPNVTCDPMAHRQRARRSPTGSTAPACRCRPIRASRSATRRATPSRGPQFWQLDFVASKRFALGGPAQFEFRIEAFNAAEPHEFPRAERQPQRRRVRHDHRRPTIRASCSSGSSSCGSARRCLVLLALARASAAPSRPARRSSSATAAPAAIGPSTRSRPTASRSRWARISSSRISSRPKTAC